VSDTNNPNQSAGEPPVPPVTPPGQSGPPPAPSYTPPPSYPAAAAAPNLEKPPAPSYQQPPAPGGYGQQPNGYQAPPANPGYQQAPPGYQPPQAQQPYNAYQGPAAPPTNTLAIITIILAFLFSIAGIVTGHIALKQIDRTGESGRGLAKAGLILSYVFTGIAVLSVIAYIIFVVVIIAAAGAGTYSTY
jgi:hypothetical protein